MALLGTPTYQLQPAAERIALQQNYINDFDFLNQYLPDTYEKEFERYGNRTIASFLRLVGAEMPSNSDQVKWAEQGRLHIKYTSCTAGTRNAPVTGQQVFTISDPNATTAAIRVNQTVFIQNNATTGPDAGATNKAIVVAVSGLQITVAFYEAALNIPPASVCTIFIYGSEFKKGTVGMDGSLQAESEFYSNKPIILKDKYAVNGSDMAQIGWVEVTTENGATGYLWYLKSEHETRLRFEDYIETAMIEAVPAAAGSGALTYLSTGTPTAAGSEGIFYVVNARGNVWGAGNPTTLADWDTIVQRLDKQGAIEENVIFVNRQFSFDIDGMLAGLNGLGGTGNGTNFYAPTSTGASFGLFDNDVQMALNLGFSGFRRGYDFYKSDWKYLNDPTMRGGLANVGSGQITGLLVPAGSTSVYDQIMGKNAKRPFLHVRYRATEAEDRRYKTWITGSAGGAATSDLDAMEVNFLSERCVCTLGANNFVLFRYGA
jgi:hypothetical protein